VYYYIFNDRLKPQILAYYCQICNAKSGLKQQLLPMWGTVFGSNWECLPIGAGRIEEGKGEIQGMGYL
jgi:hypothetical protein